jgi:hypothetical protein
MDKQTLLDAACNTPQGMQIQGMFDEQERLRDHISTRRELAQMQMRSDEIRSELCDKVTSVKKDIPGLQARIDALKVTDPELYKWITDLETINKGVWCVNCDSIKQVNGIYDQSVVKKVNNSEQRIAKLQCTINDLQQKVDDNLMALELVRRELSSIELPSLQPKPNEVSAIDNSKVITSENPDLKDSKTKDLNATVPEVRKSRLRAAREKIKQESLCEQISYTSTSMFLGDTN